ANKAAAAPSPLPSTHRTLRRRIARWFLIALASYVCFIFSLTIPVVQKHFVFAHAIKFPFFADFDAPEEYGLAPNKTRNMRLKGVDGNFIGAWHVLPDAVYRSQTNSGSNESEVFQRALCTHPVVIYLHGNAANRAAPFRTAAYAQLSSRLQANVVAIDYRGFGDSQGTPSEEGLNADARLAWDWVQEMRRACEPLHSPGKDVLVMGQSLGTGPATALTLQLAMQGTPPQGLVLLAPYRSFSQLAAGFRIGGILPVLLPALYLFPYAQAGLDLALRTKFDSEGALAAGQASTWPHVVISHAINDDVIPHSHGQAIFDKL
ncbi:alpha/beta-hydrolase, partial [Microstroma glucosiphilum]